jgi:NAD(P)-dependent dehydrogenase (short-subunit alcohol dehydrogenase family)
MDLGLGGRVAVVTGASRGIGLAAVRRLAAEGARVIAAARTNSPALAELTATGHVQFVPVDLAEPGSADRLIGAAAGHGRLDLLVNNVGAVTPRVDGFLSITDDQWWTSLNLNLMSAVRITRAVLPVMIAAGRGSIVNTGSVNAFLPDPDVMDYCAAKAALANFAKALSKQVGPQGIRVNTVSPGPVETDLWLGPGGVAATVADAGGTNPDDVVAAVAANTVTGRFTRPDEVANLIAFLASDLAANITGTDVTIDGGLVTTL